MTFSDEVQSRFAAHLSGVTRLGVAFSGGVDSSVLLALATRTLGRPGALAILGVSPSLAADERAAAHRVAATIGAPVVEVETHEMDRAAYRANGPDRCFHCKDELFTVIDTSVVADHGLDAVAYGENADDARRPDRPGSRAAEAHRVLTPLADLGLSKADVRRLAREFGLPSADKPAAPCLASRIPHFTEVDPAKLTQIETAEASLRALGFTDLRVRHHGPVARLELPLPELVRAVTDPLRTEVHAAVVAAGFKYAAVDVAGVQSGAFTLSLIEVHPPTSAPPEARPTQTPRPERQQPATAATPTGPTPSRPAPGAPAPDAGAAPTPNAPTPNAPARNAPAAPAGSPAAETTVVETRG
jgi:pyridinium-3,5-biscarboxylic acid mononucleotide sulfurtransferase